MIQFSDVISAGDGSRVLACAHCGDGYLHHKDVSVFTCEQDSDTVRHTLVQPDESLTSEVISQKDSGNPSTRRDGVTIALDCENCQKTTLLTIAQHKGVTLMNAVKV